MTVPSIMTEMFFGNPTKQVQFCVTLSGGNELLGLWEISVAIYLRIFSAWRIGERVVLTVS
jgi:hypothetical protein